ncbi:hypothetical protein BRC82_07755 [Halobacteriales archaeon QS_1_67_19]|nr:MAG: hypothetical protein BRC82_07755 [Halobacteriales archaeon QS_1_67_19]
MSEKPDELDELSDAEQEALHEMQVGIEYVYRGYGNLLDCHHRIGHAMDRFDAAREKLRDADREELATELRDRHLPAGVVGDKWTYELVSEFRNGFLADLTAFEAAVREELADEQDHLTEQSYQAEWRGRAESDAWRDGEGD